MNNNIKFVRKYKLGVTTVYDVIYHKKVMFYTDNSLPRTVVTYIKAATKITDQMDRLHGPETIYEA